MPTPKTWTDRAVDILLDERNKRYLGMTEPTANQPQTAASRAPMTQEDRLARLQTIWHAYAHDGTRAASTIREAALLGIAAIEAEAAADPVVVRAAITQAIEDTLGPPADGQSKALRRAIVDQAIALAANSGVGTRSEDSTPPASESADLLYEDADGRQMWHGKVPADAATPPPSASNEAEGLSPLSTRQEASGPLDEWLLCVAMMEVMEAQGQQKPPKDWSWRQTAMAVRAVYARLTAATSASDQEAEG